MNKKQIITKSNVIGFYFAEPGTFQGSETEAEAVLSAEGVTEFGIVAGDEAEFTFEGKRWMAYIDAEETRSVADLLKSKELV